VVIDDSVPVTARGRALFLDVDGTLLELADSPEAVRVPERLKELLAALASQEAGALALVSGRRISQIDALFAPARFPAAGLHGLERRDALGVYTRNLPDVLSQAKVLAHARQVLGAFARQHPELLLEDKEFALALHYRRAPHMQAAVESRMRALLAEMGDTYHLQPGKCVIELKPVFSSKRTAIESFMAEPPFRARSPIFVGDDITDEDGFAAVNAMGGDSIRVGGATAGTAARFSFVDVTQVAEWLARSLLKETAA
jgi:trehalose 6-phosphate phosphatase